MPYAELLLHKTLIMNDLQNAVLNLGEAYPRETTEAFLDGHVSALAFLGGVPRSILYDNTTLTVARILGDGTRRRTQAFTHLQSHYLFRDRFGRSGKGNDKGKVEGQSRSPTSPQWAARPCRPSARARSLRVSFIARCPPRIRRPARRIRSDRDRGQ